MVQDGLDVAATAGEANMAADLVYNEIHPQNGAIAIRLVGSKVGGCERDAMLQALEVGPGDGGQGSTAKSLASLPQANPTTEAGMIAPVSGRPLKGSVSPDQAKSMLEDLKTTFRAIPEIKSLEVGRVVEDSTKDYDYAVILRFNSLEEKQAYGNSEVHRRWVKEHVGDIIDKHLMLDGSNGYARKVATDSACVSVGISPDAKAGSSEVSRLRKIG